MGGSPGHISQGTIGISNALKQPSSDLPPSAVSLELWSYFPSLSTPLWATRWGWAGGERPTNPKHIMVWTTSPSTILCCVTPSVVLPSLTCHSLVAVSDEFSLLPPSYSEPCWDLGISTCLFCWRLFWKFSELVSWVYERKWRKNRNFTHNSSTSHVGLASSEFSKHNQEWILWLSF